MRILVVDDNFEVLSYLCYLLKRNEFDASPASSGKRALGLAYHKKPDLIIFDLFMPDMNGYEFCDMLKLSPDTKNIPVVFMVLDKFNPNEENLRNAGAVDVIRKPIVEKEFILKMNALHKLINDRKDKKIEKDLKYDK